MNAIVIGGGIAGLLAAQVLVRHGYQVTILERDTLPSEPLPRAGAPQAAHVHVLLAKGQQLLQHYFPGIDQDLRQRGVAWIDFVGDARRFSPSSGWGPSFTSGMQMAACTRTLLEWAIRERVRREPAVTIRERTVVAGLALDAMQRQILGVVVQPRGAAATHTTLHADLVVDASGRRSRLPAWLAAHGYAAPETTTVDSQLGYATRLVTLPDDFARDWQLLMILNEPPHVKRAGAMLAVENGQFLVGLMGGGADYPPSSDEGFRAFARSLAHPALADALACATPLSAIRSFRDTANTWRHYERQVLPEGLIVLGDAFATLSPFYGQGISLACSDAAVLDRCLRRGPAHLTTRVHRQIARAKGLPWLLATGADARYGLDIPTPGWQRLAQRYVDRAWAAAGSDSTVYTVFLRLMNLVGSPLALLRPDVIWRVLRVRPAHIAASLVTDTESTLAAPPVESA